MPIKTTHDLMKTSFRIMQGTAEFFLKKEIMHKKEGASFAKKRDLDYLASRNKGLLMDGYQRRMSEDMSFQNVAIFGATGTGKTSSFVIPNILGKARENAVFIVNDMKGSIYQATAGTMKKHGYRVIVLNLHNPSASHRYNPFLDIASENETLHMAQMFIGMVSGGSSKDSIWSVGAERFVTFFLKCLRRHPAELNTPHNLYYLFQNFGSDGSALHRWVANTIYDDPFMVTEWKSLISAHSEALTSFVMNATAALKIFANKEICQLTSASDIDLSDLRKRKTIVYVIAPPQYQKMYQPVISMYFLSFLQACMRELPGKRDLPVYFLYDEFGNSFLPDFDVFATTVREYNISLMLLMQGINQLVHRYGNELSSVILSGVVTQVSFGSAEQRTAEHFARRVGKVRSIQRPKLSDPHIENVAEYDLMSAGEIRELPDGKVLMIAKNNKSALIDIVPAYAHSKFARMMKTPPPALPGAVNTQLQFINI